MDSSNKFLWIDKNAYADKKPSYFRQVIRIGSWASLFDNRNI